MHLHCSATIHWNMCGKFTMYEKRQPEVDMTICPVNEECKCSYNLH